MDHVGHGGQLISRILLQFLEGKLAKARGQPSSHEIEKFPLSAEPQCRAGKILASIRLADAEA